MRAGAFLVLARPGLAFSCVFPRFAIDLCPNPWYNCSRWCSLGFDYFGSESSFLPQLFASSRYAAGAPPDGLGGGSGLAVNGGFQAISARAAGSHCHPGEPGRARVCC
jgi:hypothetical protein